LVDPEWIASLHAWAAGEPLIEAVYLYGGRVKGVARHDSDLDVAVALLGSAKSEKQLDWQDNSERWRADLQERLPVEIDLEFYDPDSPARIVGPAIENHGVLIYTADPQPVSP
jgi:predicted nucleotidyltransferase